MRICEAVSATTKSYRHVMKLGIMEPLTVNYKQPQIKKQILTARTQS